MRSDDENWVMGCLCRSSPSRRKPSSARMKFTNAGRRLFRSKFTTSATPRESANPTRDRKSTSCARLVTARESIKKEWTK